ncbi:hypothetical protein [Terricaulis sp.]|uniref:hypothetical protein n=1 Tax=Terricaulis sp. TaxID=2768686 RepID=UPI002AC56BA4|nr:hypothetical protein [Terricaulis sp.]MDZ4693420.1 hypothetical protein [Terricaulis sp.]
MLIELGVAVVLLLSRIVALIPRGPRPSESLDVHVQTRSTTVRVKWKRGSTPPRAR